MSWHGLQMRVAAGLTAAMLSTSPASASVVETDLLDLTAATLVEGLGELRGRFLRDSKATDREHVGGVLQTSDGRFRFTHGIAQPTQDRVSFRIRLPDDSELVGFWHTHGRQGHGRDLFSPDDSALVRESGLPFYLIDPRGQLRVLRPDDLADARSKVMISDSGRRSWAPPGSARGVSVADVT